MDRTAVVEQRRRDVFRDWLAALGPRAWSGTAVELFEELEAFRESHPLRFGTRFSPGAGLSRWLVEAEDVLLAAGRELLFARTKSERRITITTARRNTGGRTEEPAPCPR